MRILNGVIILLTLTLIIVFAYIKFKHFRQTNERTSLEEKAGKYTIDKLAKIVKQIINTDIRVNVKELNLNKYQTEKLEQSIKDIRYNLHNCGCGDLSAKLYVKNYIKDILIKQLGINKEKINEVEKFKQGSTYSTVEKFDILLYTYKKKYKLHALEKLMLDHNLDIGTMKEDGIDFSINSEDIETIYEKEILEELNYVDKLELLTQWIYQKKYGHGVIDEIRDMHIDGVSGGVGGVSAENYYFLEEALDGENSEIQFSYDNISLLFHGKTIRLKYMSFGSQKELERICKNIYRYNSPGQLHQAKGHIENDMKDGSRVVVARTPFSSSWAFFVRKHDNLASVEIEKLYTDEGSEKVIGIIKGIIKGNNNVIVSGDQASGKTTLLKSIIKFIDRSLNLRIQENLFELHLEKLYMDRDIATFRNMPNISGIDILNFTKKTNGIVTIIGEIAEALVAAWYIQTTQTASLFGLGTHHAKTTDSLLKWFRNALLSDGSFNNEGIAMEQVVEAIRFDIHVSKNHITGHRYIERITEIVPVKDEEWSSDLNESTIRFFKEMTNKKYYDAVEIVAYENGKYVVKNKISEPVMEVIRTNLGESDLDQFDKLWESYGETK